MQPELLVNRGLLPELADKFQPIFFSRKPAAHRRDLCLGEGNSATAALTRNLHKGRGSGLASRLWLDLYEAGFGARGDLRGRALLGHSSCSVSQSDA